MSAEEDLYLNQSEAEALYFSDALLGNADELDFESFGDASGLDDGTFNGITGSSLTSFDTGDIFKVTGLNGDSYVVDEGEVKCESNSTIQREAVVTTNDAGAGAAAAAAAAAPYADETHYVFNKPTLDLENMGMAYAISGLYLHGNGIGSPSSVLPSPSRAASEKLNGLTPPGQMAAPSSSYGMQLPFPRAPSTASAAATTKPVFVSLSSPTSPVVVKSQPANGIMTRFGSQEMLMMAESNGLSQSTTSPVMSPNSSDGTDPVERLVEPGMTKPQEQKQYYNVMQSERGVDSSTDFLDQVDGDGDGLQPLPQMTRPSMQRSFSSHALGQLRHMGSALPLSENGLKPRPSQLDRSGVLTSPGSRLQPNLAEFQSLGMRPIMRRVYSAGDIQTLNGKQGSLSGGASPSFDDGNYRVGKYSMEERKIRIHRYQQKRTQRNFNKKIKYACRKTLADSRPRVRGRFAKNMDDDIPTAVLGRSKREEDDDDEGHGGEANGYHFDNSSGEFSAMLTAIKIEHRRVDSM